MMHNGIFQDLARSHWTKLAFVVGAIGGLYVTASAQGPKIVPAKLDVSNYVLTFDEPFDRLDVSPWGPGTKWIAHTPWAGDFGDAAFIDPTPFGPFKTSDGKLTITMSKTAGKWTSGLLASADREGHGFVQSGGYFEMRAKLPVGEGVWPSFWLGTIGGHEEVVPEIDVIEYYGKFPDSYRSTVHLWKDGKALFGDSKLIGVRRGSLSDDYHTYGVLIRPDFVIFYLDRVEVAREPSKPEYLHPMFLMVDLAAGSGWPIDQMPNPSVMIVDYIRAYRAK